MKEAYLKSLQMIKRLDLKNEKQYNELLKNYLILNSESLKYISQTKNFKDIIKLSREVWKGFFYKFHKVAQMQQDTWYIEKWAN